MIFDFDGVIVNTEATHYKATLYALSSLNIEFDYQIYLSHFMGISDHEMFPKILLMYGFDHKNLAYVKQLMHKKFEGYECILKEKKLSSCEGFDDFYNTLLGKVKLGICTGARLPEVQAALPCINKGYSLDDFDCVTTVEQVDFGKPAPDGYLLTAEKLQISPKFCVAVEDSPVGIAAAKNAGMRVIGITSSHKRSLLSQADLVVDSLAGRSILGGL